MLFTLYLCFYYLKTYQNGTVDDYNDIIVIKKKYVIIFCFVSELRERSLNLFIFKFQRCLFASVVNIVVVTFLALPEML